MAVSEAQKKASMKYEKEKVESVRFRLPKGKRDLLKKCAEKQNLSVNQLLSKLVDNEIKRILKK